MFITKLLTILFGLSFDEPNADGVFTGEDGLPDVKVDYDALFGDKDEKKDDDKEVVDPDEDESEESDDEDTDEDDDEDAEEEDEEEDDDEDEDEEEDEDADDGVASKRLKDTQRAYHRTEAKYRKLKKENAQVLERLAKLEKSNEQPVVKDDEKKLTLKTVDPTVLAEFMKKDPVNAMRWITDQQVKLSIDQQREASAQADSAAAKQKEREEAEAQAFKSYPILEEVLELDDDDLAELKTSDPDKYKFASEVVTYYKRNLERGDDEALLNAANRVYREMNPKQLAKVLKEAKKQAGKEFRHKKQVLGKMTVAKGSKKGKKSSSGFKSISDTEFAALTPQQQDEYMLRSVDHRLQNKK